LFDFYASTQQRPPNFQQRPPNFSAVSKLLQRGRKEALTEKLSGAFFRRHGKILHF
jgi:hypothetical protein